MEKPVQWNGVDVPYHTPVPDLLHRASHPGPEAWVALMALGHHASDEAYDALLRYAESPDWRYRRAALEAIALHARSRDAHRLFCAALEDESPYVVRTACEIAGRLGIARVHSGVGKLLDSGDAATRRVAVAAIGHLWTEADFDRVRDLSRQDAALDVRREAAWTLRRNVSDKTWRQLFESWKEDELPRHRVWACEIADQFGDGSVGTALELLASDSDGHVRSAANRVLARLAN